MKRRLLVALATMILIIGGTTTLGGAPFPVPDCSCPQSTIGWMLFEDMNRDVPDFWWSDSLEVEEIEVCPHGITFRFLVKEDGNLYVAALVFPNPSGAVPKTREGLRRAEMRSGLDTEYYEERYTTILGELVRVSDGLFSAGGQIDFRRVHPDQRPVILSPARRLTLRWKNDEIMLRGYLDVFVSLVV